MDFHKILWTNGTILDVENNKEYDWIMTRNKAIYAMGNDDEQYEDYDELFDLKGKVLMSAFIKSHGSFSKDVMEYIQPDLSYCKSFEDIKNTIKDFIKEKNVKTGEWIVANGYDENQLLEKIHPGTEYLDSISKTHPISIMLQTDGIGLYNSLALNYLKKEKNGAVSAYNASNGVDNRALGFGEGDIFTKTPNKAPLPTEEQLINAINSTQKQYLSQGISLTQEENMNQDSLVLYKTMLDKMDLDLDIAYYANDNDIKSILNAFPDTEAWYDKNLKYGGIRIPLEEGSNSFNNKELNNFKIETSSDQEIYDGLKLVSDFKITPLIKINNHSGINQFLNTLEKLKNNDRDLGDYRPILVTSETLNNDQIKKVKDLNVIVSFSINKDETISSNDFILDVSKKDMMFTIHEKEYNSKSNMFELLDHLVNQTSKSYDDANKAILIKDVLMGLTTNAAFQYQEEGFRGKLERCLHADFVILSDNPLKVDSNKIKDIEILKTVIRSKVVWSKN